MSEKKRVIKTHNVPIVEVYQNERLHLFLQGRKA